MVERWSKAGIRRDALRVAFEEWFGISPALADVLIALFENKGAAASWRDLAGSANSHRPLTRNAFEVRVCELRKAMACEALDTQPEGRYLLTDVGLRECRNALMRMGDILRMVGIGEAA